MGVCKKQTTRQIANRRLKQTPTIGRTKHDDARRRLHPFHSGAVLQGRDVRGLPQGHRQADDGRAGHLRHQRPQEGRRQVQGLLPDPVLPDAALRTDDEEPSRDRGIRQDRQRRLRRTLRQGPRSLPRLGGAGADGRAGRRRPRGRTRHEDGRARRADLYQRRRPPARQSGVRAVLEGDEQDQDADLAAPVAHRELPPTTRASRSRNTKSGGRSAGPTRPPPPCRGWCSPRSWTAIRI